MGGPITFPGPTRTPRHNKDSQGGLTERPAPTVLVVDDDPGVRNSLRRALELHGFQVTVAEDGLQALRAVQRAVPDVMVVDVMMPGVDGLMLTRRLRTDGYDTPVLMLTARDGVPDRVAGLDTGADDYLVKPFALEELLARLRAMLRRAEPRPLRQFADVVVDPDTLAVRRGERAITLTRTEFDLLMAFMDNPRRVLSRAALQERVWGTDAPVTDNAVEVYVGYLRRKLEAGGESRLVHTVRGFGYVLREP